MNTFEHTNYKDMIDSLRLAAEDAVARAVAAEEAMDFALGQADRAVRRADRSKRLAAKWRERYLEVTQEK